MWRDLWEGGDGGGRIGSGLAEAEGKREDTATAMGGR